MKKPETPEFETRTLHMEINDCGGGYKLGVCTERRFIAVGAYDENVLRVSFATAVREHFAACKLHGLWFETTKSTGGATNAPVVPVECQVPVGCLR